MNLDRCARADPFWLSHVRELVAPTTDPLRHHGDIGTAIANAWAVAASARSDDGVQMMTSLLASAHSTLVPVLHGYLGLARALQGDYEGALRELTVARRDESRKATWLYNVGVVCTRKRNLEAAIGAFAASADANDAPVQVWAVLALYYTLSGIYPRAELAARRALQLGCNLGNDLVSLCLVQATLLQGKKPDGAFSFASLDHEPGYLVEAIEHQLPPVSGDGFAHRSPGTIVFVACDPAYLYEHAIPLLWSLKEYNRDPCSVHVHIINPDEAVSNAIAYVRSVLDGMQVVLTTENPELRSQPDRLIYYSCARFCRLYQLLRENEGAIVIALDADMLIRDNLAKIPGVESGMRHVGVVRLASEPIWDEIVANSLWIRASATGRRFLARAVDFILENFERKTARWFLDQMALWLACKHFDRPQSMELMPPCAASDREHLDAAVIWAVTNDKQRPGRFVDEKAYLVAKYGSGWTFSEDSRALVKSVLEQVSRAGGSSDEEQALRDVIQIAGLCSAYLTQRKLLATGAPVVSDGPFRGMRLPYPEPVRAPGELFTQSRVIAGLIAGSFEAELHPHIETASAKTYEIVVNVGCGEGYYAVGCALRMRAARVFAYDIDPIQRRACRVLARLNEVEDRIAIGDACSVQDLARFRDKRTLVICDIEGGELELLDPERIPALRGYDLIVELHEVFAKGTVEKFLRHFEDSHELTLVRNGNRRVELPALVSNLSSVEAAAATCDFRLGPTPWAVLIAKGGSPNSQGSPARFLDSGLRDPAMAWPTEDWR